MIFKSPLHSCLFVFKADSSWAVLATGAKLGAFLSLQVGSGLFQVRLRQAGTWDTLLQWLHLDKCLLEQQNTNKL